MVSNLATTALFVMRGIQPDKASFGHEVAPLELTPFIAIVLAGCTSTSSSLLNFYLISLSYMTSTPSTSSSQANPGLARNISDLVSDGTRLEVRTGYLKSCVKYAHGIWECHRDVTDLVQRIHPDQDPLNLIWQSQKFRDNVVFYPMMSVISDLTTR